MNVFLLPRKNFKMEKTIDALELKLDEKCYIAKFTGKTVEEVALSAKKGDLEALEEIYLRFFDTMNDMAIGLSITYKTLDEDLSTYAGLISDSLQDAVNCFNPSKGHFVNIWRTILKWKRLQLVSKLCASHKPGRKNTNRYFNDEDLESDCDLDDYLIQTEYDFQEKNYEAESAELILSFIEHHYSSKDYKIIRMWMMSFSLKEISNEVEVPLKKVYGKVYTLINAVRKAVSDGVLKLN